jgi:trafficking protein particle complex subunit 13
VPSCQRDSKRLQRVISLVAQHVQPRRVRAVPAPEPASSHPDAFSPQLPSALASASPILSPLRGALSFGKSFVVSPEHFDIDGHTDRHSGEMSRNVDSSSHVVVLPPPFTDGEGDVKMVNSKGVLFLGSSAIHLEPIRLSSMTMDEKGEMDDGNASTVKVEAAQEFGLSYIPLAKGFSIVGGLRIILVGDQLVEEDQAASNQTDSVRGRTEVRILKEWDVIAEIWVKT